MEKERKRAEEMGYPSPIQATKSDTDTQYDLGITYCIDNYNTIGFCNASHNLSSNLLQANLIEERKLDKSHRHLNFCQLLGMSDYITFNLAEAGYNVAKYTPYGPVKEVIPYLIRRAEENTSVTGEASRELELVLKELKRRNL
jgi:proline dehydrogenase